MALYLVGTPIGNLKDITERARETLAQVDHIACEDTRRTLILLNALGIKKSLISYYKQKEKEGAEKILSLLKEGKHVALVSDAGMPVISDPGALLVRRAREEGVRVESVPGPTAVTTAAALAGVDQGFVFLGFLPEKESDRKKRLAPFIDSPIPLVFYAGPHDVKELIRYLYSLLGERKAYLARELTKLHEEVKEITLSADYSEEARGEYVIIVEGKEKENPLLSLTPEEHLEHYLSRGMDKKTAVKTVASERGVPKDDIYKLTIKN
ncbi:MAG TPA: 16S rRNA (cytidine(1402)-2'-O)-methyltransferase [Clostridiales bacterium]|nr:16S rRNA (cytidine(1402)-2'-O)-methyltransferase [Clostridiales bacterium]